MGFNSKGNGFEISSLGSSTASFPLPSSISIGEVSSFFSHGPHTTHNCGASSISQELLLVPLSIPPEAAV